MNIEIKAPDLRRVFGTTVPWAAVRGPLALVGLRLIVTKDRVWAVAVDPHCLAYDSAPCAADGDAELTLPRAAVSFALREIAALPGTIRKRVEVQITEADIRVMGATLAYEPPIGFPNWRQVIPTAAASTTSIAIAPFFLARLHKVAKISGIPIATLVFNGPLGPVDIRIGETFRVIVMPVRVVEEQGAAPLPPSLGVEAAA